MLKLLSTAVEHCDHRTTKIGLDRIDDLNVFNVPEKCAQNLSVLAVYKM